MTRSRSASTTTCIALALVLHAACAAPPQHARSAQPAPVQTSSGALLPPGAADNVVDSRLEQHAHDPQVQALVDAFRRTAHTPLTAGNRVTLLVDGPQTLASMRDAIASAQHYVHLETYIYGADQVGREVLDLLVQRRREGVEVRVLYDAIGSLGTTLEFFQPLRDLGGEVLEYRPLNPIRSAPPDLHNRDHRKILVVDGVVAFTGGVNISTTYASSSRERPGPEAGRESAWRDTHVRIEGAAAARLQEVFVENWRAAGGGLTQPPEVYTPQLAPDGAELVAAVATRGGDAHEATIYNTYVAIVQHASRRLWLTQAYFAPNEVIRRELAAAAQRGVDVRIITPGFTDSALIFHASRSTYDELLRAGVRIYEQRDALLHAKTLVADSALSIVGSANFDMRSFMHNDEVNAVIVGADFAREMERMFEVDVQYADEITHEEWRGRPFLDRLKEVGSRLFYYWL